MSDPSITATSADEYLQLLDRLKFADSVTRAYALVDVCQFVDFHLAGGDDRIRALLAEHWTGCDGAGELADELYELFDLVGWTSDTPEPMPRGRQRIYRAHYVGTDPLAGLSWTTSRAKADWFAEYMMHSPRAGLIGMPGGLAQVTVARCSRFLARFSGRGEFEVIPDRTRVRVIGTLKAAP